MDSAPVEEELEPKEPDRAKENDGSMRDALEVEARPSRPRGNPLPVAPARELACGIRVDCPFSTLFSRPPPLRVIPGGGGRPWPGFSEASWRANEAIEGVERRAVAGRLASSEYSGAFLAHLLRMSGIALFNGIG